MVKRIVQPLSMIPSSRVVEERLREIRREAEALEYLLSVSREVERITSGCDDSVERDLDRREVAHAG